MRHKKKIVHIVSVSFSIPYFFGEQIPYFNKKGFSFSVICSPSSNLEEFSQKFEFDSVEVEIKREINIFSDIRAIFEIFFYLRREKVETVIAHSPKGGLVGMIAAKIAGVPKRIFFRHGLPFETQKGIKRGILILCEKICGLFASKVVSVSPSILKQSEKFKLNAGYKNLILNKGTCNGVNTKWFDMDSVDKEIINSLKDQIGIDKNDIVYGFVGRVSKDKGVLQLLDAWREFSNEVKNAKLLIIGPIDTRDPIGENFIEEVNHFKNVIYLGEKADVKNYYSIMDVFVLPSFREGFPTVVLEASAMKVPIITTKVTGCIDSIKDNFTGIFTDINANSINEALKFYYLNPCIRKMHGENGYQFIKQNFDQDLVWREIENLL